LRFDRLISKVQDFQIYTRVSFYFKTFLISTQSSPFSEGTHFRMYTQVYCRRAKKQASAMAPRRAAKANVEVAAQGPDNVSDTSPRTGGSVPTWSFISDILQSELVNYSDSDDDDNDIVKDDLNTKYKTIVQSGCTWLQPDLGCSHTTT
jgi:hypothetical protein